MAKLPTKAPEKTATSSDIRLINFSSYVKPKPEIESSKEWVLNGKNNSFYQYLIDRYNGSATHSAILNSYVDLTYGQGLVNLNANVEDWLKFNRMLRTSEVKKIVSDYVVFGEAIVGIIKANNPTKLPTVTHLPKQNTAPNKANEKNEVDGYWYSQNWCDINKPENAPRFLPLLTEGKEENCYAIKPYRVGMTYFCDPDYIGGVQYAEMEEEISNYYISHIRNGLSFGYIINIPDGNSYTPEEKDLLEKQIKSRLTGSSNAGRFIINFNGRDTEITVTAIEMNDAHSQWEYLTGEARQQLLTAHRVTSPMLFGIKDNTGLGNNADEMDTAEAQLMKRVISPKQAYLIDAFETIAEAWGLKLKLAFKPLTEPRQIDKTIDKNIDVKFSSDEKKKWSVADLIELGETFDATGYDVYEGEVDYDEEDSYELKMTSTGTAFPNAKSEQDNKDVIIRYRYAGNPNPERDFCRQMMRADKLYRKEDILRMGEYTVNEGFGMSPNPNEPYSIWLWKGGGKLSDAYPNGTCKHKWNRVIFVRQGVKVDVNSPLAKMISTTQARSAGYKIPVNDPRVGIAPHDMKI